MAGFGEDPYKKQPGGNGVSRAGKRIPRLPFVVTWTVVGIGIDGPGTHGTDTVSVVGVFAITGASSPWIRTVFSERIGDRLEAVITAVPTTETIGFGVTSLIWGA